MLHTKCKCICLYIIGGQAITVHTIIISVGYVYDILVVGGVRYTYILMVVREDT